MLGKHLNAFPSAVAKVQVDHASDVPGLVSMEQFTKLTLPKKLAMRQKLLAVLQEFSGPRVVNE